jgi:hypothetical protein
MTRRSLTLYIWMASLLVALIAGSWLALKAHDARDLVKFRNAMVVEVGAPDVFDWRPASRPADFREEHAEAPPEMRDAVNVAVGSQARDSEFLTALDLARHLAKNRQRGSLPIQESTIETYRAIVGKGQGYCADFTQVFNGLAHAAGIEVREWGMSFEGYGGNGHAFSEVFDRGRDQWVFIDSFYSFYVSDRTGRPLSASELRDRLLAGSTDLHVEPIVAEKFGFKTPEKALAYYRRGAGSFYMWWGNDVFTYDNNAVLAHLGASRALQQLAGIVIGIQPSLMLAASHIQTQGLFELRLIRGLLVALTASMTVFAITSLMLLAARRRRAARHERGRNLATVEPPSDRV